MRENRVWSFDPFRLDIGNEQLWHGQEVLRLTRKTFAVLRYLVEHPGQLVTKDEIFAAVWPMTAVGDAVLAVCIRDIRQALGDSPRKPQFIETVYGRGYRFLVPVTVAGDTLARHNAILRSSLAPDTSPPSPICLVGREAEYTQLQQGFKKALHGERQVVFITGEAGIGKTTLIEAFVERVAADEAVWLGHGQCVDQYGAGEAYLPLLEALGRLCRTPGNGYLRPLLQRCAPSWLLQMPALLSAVELETLRHHAYGATQARMLRELAEAVDMLTAERPLVLVLEDLHWSDDATLAWLACVARRQEKARLLIIGTYRPVEARMCAHPVLTVVQELLQHGQGEELRLAYLTEPAVETYLMGRFARPSFLHHLARAIHQRTSGNPLFMVTVVDALVRQGILHEAPEGWALLGTLEEVTARVPESLRQLIEQQLSQISLADQAMLEAASVVGAVFSVAAVAAGMQHEEIDVETRCEALARREQLICARGIETWPDGTITARYGFIHALYHEVLYHRVSSGRRVRLHQRIGIRKEAGYAKRAREIAAELAVHFECGRDARRALQYWQYAGDNMLQRCAHREAIACYQHALDVLQQCPASRDHDQQAIDIHFAIYRAGVPLGAYDRIMTVLREAESLAESLADQGRLGQLCSRLSYACRVMGNYDQAMTYARRGIAIGETLGDGAVQAQAMYRLGQAYRILGDYQRASTCLRHIVHTHQGKAGQDNLYGFPSVFARAQLALCLAERGEFAEGIAHGAEGVRTAEAVNNPFGRIVSYGGIGGLYLRQGAFPDAIRVLDCAFDLCRHWDMLDWFSTIATFLGTAYSLAGHVAAALPLLEQAVEQGRTLGKKAGQAFVMASLGEVYLRAGRAVDALDHARQALELSQAYKERGAQAWSLRLLGEITAQVNPLEVEPSRTHYQQALTLANELGMRPLQAHCHQGLGTLYSQTGASAQARAKLATAMAMYCEMEMTFWLPKTEAVLTAVEGKA